MIKTQVGLHVKYTLFFSDLNVTFLCRLSENTQIPKFHENPPSGVELLHVDEQT